MTTKADFIASMGGAKIPVGIPLEFVRSSGDILTAVAHGFKTGAGPYKIFSTAAAPAGLVAAVRASKIYTPATDIQDETVTIDGKVYTWRNSPAADGEIVVNASDLQAAQNLANAINLGPGGGLNYNIAMVGNPNVRAHAFNASTLVEAKTFDATLGNAIAIAEAAAGSWAGGAIALSDGVDGTDYFIIRLSADAFSLATSRVDALAGVAVTITDDGIGAHMMVLTADTLAEELWNAFVGATVTVGRVFQVLKKTGWVETAPHRIEPGDTFRVQDDGSPVRLVPELDPDPGVYTAAQVQSKGVHFYIQLPGGDVLDRVATFEVA